MFRRKPKSKNSFLVLHSSNRGSDIVRPENTSLIVNESDTREENFERKFISTFSEDEDDKLEVSLRKSSSLMTSLSQKKQSTPLNQAFSRNNLFLGQDKSFSQIHKSKLPCSDSEMIPPVNFEEISYFEEILKIGGAVPLPESSSFLLSEDQAVFSIKINKKLTENGENVKRFIQSLKEKMKHNKYFQKMLAHTLTDENCESARGPVQEPLMRMLLNVECLQADLIKLLLEKVGDIIVENKVETENVQLVSSSLSQIRFLHRVKDIKIACRLLEILEVATVNVKREIIFLLPEIISEEETQETCMQLMEMLKFEEILTNVIIDTLTNLPLTKTLRTLVCTKILQRLDKCPLEYLPSLVQFVLNRCQTEELDEVINGLRHNLPFSPQHYEMRMTDGNCGKKFSDEASYVKLTFENLKFSLMSSKEMTDVWIKVISSFNSSIHFRCVDLVVLIILYNCLFGRKSQILQLIRNKIKSTILTQYHVQNMFKILSVITEEYSTTILEIASVLLKSFDSKISGFGAVLYKKCFTHFHYYMKQIVISEILLHIGTGPSFTINIALHTLKELCESEKEALSQHTAAIMGLLFKIADLELVQVRLLMDVIADLVFFGLSGEGTAAPLDELQIFIRKQLVSSKPEQCKKGVLAAIMFGKHSGKDDDREESTRIQSNSLLELAMGSKGVLERRRGFFNDEFATMTKESQLSNSFLEIWSKKTFSLVMSSLFVKTINAESRDFPTSVQYPLHCEDVDKLYFPVIEFIIKSESKSTMDLTLPVIPSTLRLLWCLERNSERILPVFCAAVIMPEATVYDNLNSFSQSQKQKIMTSLFLCGNYLIECVNALCAHGMLDKAVLRVKQLISVRQLIARYVNLVPEFVPPLCQFYSLTQSLVRKKVSEKRTKKRKLNEVSGENSFLESQRTQKIPARSSGENISPTEQTGQDADLLQYSSYFRELDLVTSELLGTDFKFPLNERSDDLRNVELGTCDILFLLEDLIYKSEQVLKSSEVSPNFKIKPTASLMQKMTPEELIVASVKILPQLLNKIDTFSQYCENLLESNGWIYNSRGLYVEGACHIKLAVAACLKFIANIVSWQGVNDSESNLHREFLLILASRKNICKVNSSFETLEALASAAAEYLITFGKSVLILCGGLSIVKSLQAFLRYCASKYWNALADLCREFLCRSWFTVTGTPDGGHVYNQHVDFLLKTYFSVVEDKLEVVCVTAKTALEEIGGLAEKDSGLKTLKTINKKNFPLLYRTLCEALSSTSANELSSANNSEKQLLVWNKVVETLLVLVETAKVHSSRVILASLLKRSQSIIQLFLSKGMPVVESALRVKSVEVLTLLKSFQMVTRFLHSICCHSRITNDSVVAAHVPAIRSLCERLTLEVKGMLILNGIPMECITIAILKNRDIKGNDIISQESFDDDSDDDSQLPPEDTPDAEEKLSENISEEMQDPPVDEEKPQSNGRNVEPASVPEPAAELPERPKMCCSARLLFSIICFFAIFNSSYVRVGISMAMVCMVVPEGKCKDVNEKRSGEFTWSSSTEGYLISAIFYGFLVGPFVAGILSFKVGGKLVLVIGAIGTSATFLLTPEAARTTPILLFALRVVTGFFTGFTFPAFYDLVSHWIIPEERQLLVSGALAGIPAASIANFPISSVVCSAWGWIWLFYTIAIWMFLFGLIYVFSVFNYPEDCPFITEKELRFLNSRIPGSAKHAIPWRKIAKSLPIYAYVVIHFCVNYVYLSMVFSLPLLMENVHHFPIQENGLLSATPFMGSLLMRILLSLFFEQLRKKLKLSKNTLRKIFVFLGAFLVSLFLLISTFLSYSYRYWILGCFILASSSLELCLTGGYLLSLLDLCPSYVNILTGIANAIGNAAGLICPVVNGLITPHGTREEWNSVFYVNISILLGATIFYLVFGQNHLLYWGLVTLPSQAPLPRASLVN